jgi:predicted nucleic acid-binding protein
VRLLLDTNVVLDLMLARQPFAVGSAAIIAAIEAGKSEGYLCATTVTTIHYLAVKALGKKQAEAHVSALLGIFRIAAVNEAVLSAALKRGGKDFEDDVVIEAALNVGADAIVTRNAADFRRAPLAIYQPRDVIALLDIRGGK